MTSEREVVVLGGGVTGVTSAYHLARSGWRVTLIERQPEAGLETSFANGGLITPSMSDPWAAPGMPRQLLKWLGREGSPFLVRPSAIPGLMSWGMKFLRQCNAGAWRRNTETTLRLCRYSHDCLKALIAETGIEFDVNRRGTLHLFRDELSMKHTQRAADVIRSLGVESRTLTAADCIALEPALATQADQVSGGIHYPDDEAGDAHIFTQRLAALCETLGVTFRYGETVRSLETAQRALTAVVTDRGRLEADTCVVALGTASRSLLRPLGLHLPIYPVKGYSVTFPVEGWNAAPVVPFVDDGRKMGVVRIGDRIRVAGTAEFAGDDKTLTAERVANLRSFFLEVFPDYPDREAGRAWTGLRPTTPDGIPYLGPSPVRGLYLNTGHGHLGWTMSCGSASILSDLLNGEAAAIDLTGMTFEGR